MQTSVGSVDVSTCGPAAGKDGFGLGLGKTQAHAKHRDLEEFSFSDWGTREHPSAQLLDPGERRVGEIVPRAFGALYVINSCGAEQDGQEMKRIRLLALQTRRGAGMTYAAGFDPCPSQYW